MSEVPYNDYDRAYEAIHSALNDLMAPQPKHKITGLYFTWNEDGTLATITAKEDATELFTIAFVWDVDGNMESAVRTDAL